MVFEAADNEGHEFGEVLTGLAAEEGFTLKAYSFMYSSPPNGYLFVLRSKEAVSA